MRFAFIADIHLSKYGQDKIEDETNLPDRLNSIKSCLYEVADYCKETGVENIIIGGDVLHGKSVIYAIAQDILIQFLEDFPEIQFYIIDGNHDLSGKGEDVVSALRPLRTVGPHVKWISFKEVFKLDEPDMIFVPYSYNISKNVKKYSSRILVSHFGLNEAMVNSGMSMVSDLSIKDLIGRYQLVLLGHYHKPQDYVSEQFKLYYSGSLIQLDWGEKNDEKRFLIVNTDTLDVVSVPIKAYKKHIEIAVTNENKRDALKEAEKQKASGNYVKIITTEKVDLGKVGEQFNVVDKSERDITDRGITSSMSQRDKLKKYLEIQEMPTEGIYMELGMEIVNEVGEIL